MATEPDWQFDYEQCPLSALWVYKFDHDPIQDGAWHGLNDKGNASYRIVEGTLQFVAFGEAMSDGDRSEVLQRMESCGPLEINGSKEIVIRRKGAQYEMWSHWVLQRDGVELTGLTATEFRDAYRRLLKLEAEF